MHAEKLNANRCRPATIPPDEILPESNIEEGDVVHLEGCVEDAAQIEQHLRELDEEAGFTGPLSLAHAPTPVPAERVGISGCTSASPPTERHRLLLDDAPILASER